MGKLDEIKESLKNGAILAAVMCNNCACVFVVIDVPERDAYDTGWCCPYCTDTNTDEVT